MSMYNMMHGTNPHAALLLAMLGFSNPSEQIPRLRDCYVDDDGHIVVFTRTGGGNRPDYAEQNATLEARTGFLRTEDWATDTTFAKWVYAAPEGSEKLVRQLADTGARSDPTEKFEALIADMQAGATKPSTRQALERAKPLMEQLRTAIEGRGPAAVAVNGKAKFNTEE